MSRRALFGLLALLGCSRTTEPTNLTRETSAVSAPAEIRIDSHGWPHIRAVSLRDAAVAQGYAMARDRMPQMEFFRRAASGRLAEVFGSISAQFIQTDVLLRTLGLHATAQKMWDALPEGRSRTLFQGFSDGVNVYLDEVKRGERRVQPGAELLLSGQPDPWSPVDSLAVLRILVYYLSYGADGEIANSFLRDQSVSVFAQADAARSDLLARRGFFHDLFAVPPPSHVLALPSFYASAPAPRQKKGPGRNRSPMPSPLPEALFDSGRALASVRAVLGIHDDPGSRGSNAWGVAGSQTASGHALIAGDPHQGLLSPSFLYCMQIVVTSGPDAVEFEGSAFPGLPGMVFGHSGTVAWGVTNAAFDLVDVYEETITKGVDGAPDTVLFNGKQVPLETHVEEVPNGLLGKLPLKIEVVPHHGPLLPLFEREGVPATRKTSGKALSVRWVANDPTHEVEGLVGLLYAKDVDAAMLAVRNIEAPSLSFVFGDRAGNIAFRQVGRVPVRAPGALTYDPVRNPGGTMPGAVLPGTGEAEWLGNVDPDNLPNVLNPPFVATSNNDVAGLSRDGNPFDERVYLGSDWAEGFRYERIAQRLSALDGKATADDMRAIQDDHVVLAGARLTPFLTAALKRLDDEWAHPGSQADLVDIAKKGLEKQTQLRDIAARLGRWTFDTPTGLEDDADAPVRDESIAAAVFHVWLARTFELAFADELDALQKPGKSYIAPQPRRLLWTIIALLEHPELSRTLDAATGQSVLWDDLTTRDVKESRDATLLAALLAAMGDLTRITHSAEVAQWQWGKVHTVRLGSFYPHVSLSLGTDLNLPQFGDLAFPNGFPRPGGIESIDQGWPAFTDSKGRPGPAFSYNIGPAERRVVEMKPDGPDATDVLAGGESGDVSSPHFRDEMELWRHNHTHGLLRDPQKIVADTERRIELRPP